MEQEDSMSIQRYHADTISKEDEGCLVLYSDHLKDKEKLGDQIDKFSLLDQIAIEAMNHILRDKLGRANDKLAKEAYEIAQAMMEERERQ